MIDQLEIDEWVRLHHHAGDPSTSRRAAERATGLAARHRALVLGWIRTSPVPIAAEEIADQTGLSTLQVMKRVSDLRNDARIAESGQEHRNRSGRMAIKWRAVQ